MNLKDLMAATVDGWFGSPDVRLTARWQRVYEDVGELLKAARREALEEAAKESEDCSTCTSWEIAAQIRALGSKK